MIFPSDNQVVMKKGVKVKVIDNTTQHMFPIGTIVECIDESTKPRKELEFLGIDDSGELENWWMQENEYEKIEL